ncbi:EamA family transporter [Haloarchaeobius sp. HME9146]|uniref:DMT family transporter n=1 Tax=Haloarchaeobius sp. HME9146 TaxID=2978732 RepID=UPI0021BEBB82|nr:EamA family transporter [Haloarchaeobius sp. HME9146]
MRNRFAVIGLFGLLATLWGLSFPAISVGLETLDPILFASFRYDIAAVLLVGYGVVRTAEWYPTARNDLAAVLAGGVFLVAGNALLFLGQKTVPSGVAAVMQSLVPIATTLWALGILPEERVSTVGAVGILLGFLGVGLIVRPDPGNLFAGGTLGRLLILGQVASVSLGGVLVQRSRPTLDRAALSGWSMAVGGVILHLTSVAVGEPFAIPAAPKPVAAVLYLGVFATALAFFIYYSLLEVRGALETSLVAYLVPVVATIAGVFILNEQITPLTIAGFFVVFLGFVLLKRRALAELVVESRQPSMGD